MSTPITKFVTVSARLASKVLPAATFGNGLFLGCHEDYNTLGEVPPDQRYLSMTKDDFADYLDPDSEAYAYALAYFSQDYTPDALIVGRSFFAATSPYTLVTGGTAVAATFEAVSAGAIHFVDSEGSEDEINGIDFTGVTSYAQVLTKVNEAIANVEYPNISGLGKCTFVLDNLGRLAFNFPAIAGAPFTKLPDASTTYTDYTAVTAGKLKFTDDATVPNTVELTGLDFHTCTTFAQVLGVINLALGSLVDPAIDGLELCTFQLDSEGVVCFQSTHLTGADARTIALTSTTDADLYGAAYLDGATQVVYSGVDANTGSAARTISFDTAAVGVDLMTNSYLGGTYDAISGYDIESITETLQALQELTTFYNVTTFADHGDTTISDADYLEFCQYVETQILQADICTYDTITKSASPSASLAYQINALGLDRTTVYYTERTDQRPDGANSGYVFPQKAGSCSFAYNPLSGVSESGLTKTLTSGEMLKLEALHVLYVCEVGDVRFVFKSLTTSGEEKRLILGIDWFNATCQIDIMNDRLTKPIHTYDYGTFAATESILYRNAAEAYNRGIFYARDDKDYPFTVTMPDPSDFSKADKKTHIFDKEVFHGTAKSEILQWAISGTIEI